MNTDLENLILQWRATSHELRRVRRLFIYFQRPAIMADQTGKVCCAVAHRMIQIGFYASKDEWSARFGVLRYIAKIEGATQSEGWWRWLEENRWSLGELRYGRRWPKIKEIA